MRGLHGDFGTMPLKDLVVYLGNKRASGDLTLERGSVKKSVSLRDGQVVNASSNQPREYLGQFLINLGHISEDQFNKAYETQKETKIFLGRILVMIGAVSEKIVLSTLSLKFRETLLEAFLWADGNFVYNAAATGQPLEGLDLKIDLLDIHREGEFRETAWQAIRGAFPRGDLSLTLKEENLPERPKPGSLDEKLFAMINEGRSIDELVLALHATDFYLYQRLYALYRLDAVTVASPEVEIFELPPGSPLVGDEPSGSDILRHAREFLDSGDAKGAEALARRAHEVSPSVETAEILRKAETALLSELRKSLVEGKPIPSLKVAPSALKSIQLSAPEKYLLSRIDGRRDIGSIVHVSPLHELEALKYFDKFLSAGLVELTRG